MVSEPLKKLETTEGKKPLKGRFRLLVLFDAYATRDPFADCLIFNLFEFL